MSKANEADPRILSIERTFQAPIQLVWEAWTRPEHIANWWGPQGMEVKIVKHEFRVGGSWEYSMLMPDGNEFISDGVYSEIVEPKRLVTTANFRPMTEGVELQILLEADGNATHFTFNVVHPTEAYRMQQEKTGFYNGRGSAFDRLEVLLGALTV